MPQADECPAEPVAGGLPSGDALISALVDAAASIAQSEDRLAKFRILAYRDSLPPGLIGSYVPVLGCHRAIHVGILSDECSCYALAWSVEGSAALSELGTRTVICDLTQRMAWALARQSNPSAPPAVGEPIFVDGIALRTLRVSLRAVEVVFGVTRATLVVIGADALIRSEWPGMDNRVRLRPEKDCT